MLLKKYSPSVKNNNELKEKAVAEIKAFICRLERGRFLFQSDRAPLLLVIGGLKSDVELLDNTVGTGEENIEALANNVFSLLKDFKKLYEEDMLHRIQSVAEEIRFNVNLWRDVLDGSATLSAEDRENALKSSYTHRELAARLSELDEIKEILRANAKRLEKEIDGYEKDISELDGAIANEDNERKIHEICKKISIIKLKLESLVARKANYVACFDLLDMICVNAVEALEAGGVYSEEADKAAKLLDIKELKKVLSEPDKAIAILKRMELDAKPIFERTKDIDTVLLRTNTEGAVTIKDALAYKSELVRKKK